jgi:glucose-6-phosphate 1-dehydrogenase
MNRQHSLMSKISPAPPCTLVVFGARGDLTKRLLIPSLYTLAGQKLLESDFCLLGVDRADGDDEGWRAELRATMQSFTTDPSGEFYAPSIDERAWSWLASRMHYVSMDFTDSAAMDRLKATLSGNAVFYCAVAPRFFGVIAGQLGRTGLLHEAEGGFRRIVVEKPFGADLASARALNAVLLKEADERQIFRVDHFLGKETVQNILALRFGNGIFEPLWRREHIDHIQITAAETVGVEQRGAFYDPTGALRDMVPNHLFTLLSVVAMEPPNSFDAESVRTVKQQFLESLRPVRPEDVVRGQYTAGSVRGSPVAGYRDSAGVAADSKTETYVAMMLQADNWRWAGVPFYLRTGKCMTGRRTEVVVRFRQAPYAIFRGTPVDRLTPNDLVLNIHPQQGIAVGISAKLPGPLMDLASVSLAFRYEDAFRQEPNVGYETLIYDCLKGDATLFQRADNIDASWAAVNPALASWAETKSAPAPYAAGSAGPAAADELLARSGRHWAPLADT